MSDRPVVMSGCPVVQTIKDLYSGGFEYASYDGSSSDVEKTGGDAKSGTRVGTADSETSILIPSGIAGGGSTSTEISMETVKFYITVRKLQFARAELNVQRSASESNLSIIGAAQTPDDIIQPANIVYFERMFKDYYGKTSKQILNRIIGPSKLYNVITRAVDLIDIMEGICVSKLARDFPSGMSIPTVYFDPSAIENIDLTDNIYSEINKILDYANNLSVCGIRTKIEHMAKFDQLLRDFTFTKPQNNSLQEWKGMLELDMEVANYAYALEQYQCNAIKKLNEVMNLSQSIIDLGAE